jgi:phospho-N-acetylmuramoyl-pentapeptide-transferase
VILWAIELLRAAHVGVGFLRLGESVTFRAIMALATSLALALALGWKVVVWLYRRRFRDTSGEFLSIRTHSKQGTPTGGGLLILLSTAISVALWGHFRSVQIVVLLGGFVYLGCVGLLDDALKVRFKSSLFGLGQLAKTALLLGFVVPFAWYLVSPWSPLPPSLQTSITLPFVKHPLVDVGPLAFAVFAAFVLFSIINAVNVTDGMDGLLCGASTSVLGVYVVFAYVLSNALLSRYLLFPFVPGSEEVVIFGTALIGGVLGFLWRNTFPAEVFMGDTGSLAIGGAIGMMAFLLRQEMLFPIVGGLFVLEIFTSLLQEKIGTRLGRRIVLRAPFHHALTHRGIAEPKAVVRLWIVSFLLAAIGLLSLKVR